MKCLKYFCRGLIIALLFLTNPLLAQPTFQVWSPDWIFASDYGTDQATWFVDSNSFELWIVCAYHQNTDALSDIRLLVSVPDGETGSIVITDVPYTGTNEPTFIGMYSDPSFFPPGANFNSHYPLDGAISDFIIYDMDPVADVGIPIFEYNADNYGSISPTNSTGQVKRYLVTVSGYSWVHFDMYGRETQGIDYKWKSSWDVMPSRYDVTYISGLNTLQMLEPNGSENLVAGHIYVIRWWSTGSISDVLIEYSSNNGIVWNNVNVVPNTGTYNWLVPWVDSSECLVRISNADDPNISDTSDGVFTIGHNTVPVVSNVTASQRIDGSKLVDIYYDVNDVDGDLCTIWVQVSDDGGTTWNVRSRTFVEGSDVGVGIAPGTGKYVIWDCGTDLPGANGTNYKIRVYTDDDDGDGPGVMLPVPGSWFPYQNVSQPEDWIFVDSLLIDKYEVTNVQRQL